MEPRLIADSPPELLILDDPDDCPYLPGRRARLPMRLPIRPLTPAETDTRLARGDRRHGRLLYRPACESCRACEPIRLTVPCFAPSRSQRRVLRRGDQWLTTEIGQPAFSDERLALYDRHKRGRDLLSGDGKPLGEAGYRGFLVERCVSAWELRIRQAGRLVGVAVFDRGQAAVSSVYCYFDPELASLSIGTYAILKQIELCRSWQVAHLYLGYYIADNKHMRYKARFRPHERLIDGRWQARDTVAREPETP